MYKLAAISFVIHIHNTVRGTANPYEYNDAKRKHFKLIVLGNIVGYCSAILIIDYFTLPSSQRPFLRKRDTFATLPDQPLSLQSFFFPLYATIHYIPESVARMPCFILSPLLFAIVLLPFLSIVVASYLNLSVVYICIACCSSIRLDIEANPRHNNGTRTHIALLYLYEWIVYK